MTIKCYNDPIPKHRIKQFTEILGLTGGRYLSNPKLSGQEYRVDYQPGDYSKQCHLYRQATTDIKEINSSGKWKTLLRRVVKFLTK